MAISGYFLPSASDTDNRHDTRRKLSLLTRGAQHDGAGIEVEIHNISGTGLLLESDIKLAAGDRIEIELPHAGDISAVVIWASGRLFGCQFEGPVSPATLSAVELKSAVEPKNAVELKSAAGPAPSFDEDIAAPAMDESFGFRLQRLRTTAGLRQSEVAVRMGVSAASVTSWEKGRARPKRSSMEKLAAILGVETADLLDDAAPGGLQKLLDRCREQIARAVGTRPDRIRIVVEL
ncbi:transcriptional regulator with XRE-family HTH domain [Sphingopyxis panaciterrae]|uniref:helix-turn-helix domain-containing protein n=1 Tax=Sphingopyxis panaciterrae TaxID=363841 RepID=UPI00141D822F|nr:helix-turn-helix domain-containing protein [Sphingopyxis panaciterrae]NIJ38191.1 transcriptional regulator with XRE-family HTH domain [Sphingopyxis panaciterrae]